MAIQWDDTEEPTVQWDDSKQARSNLLDKINQINTELNLPEGLSLRQLKQESGLNLRAYNRGSKAAGLAQVIPATQRSLEKRFGRELDPYNVDDALLMYKEVMRENLQKFGNVPDALRAYNSGWVPDKWDNPETNDYVAKILPVPKVEWDKPESNKLKQAASSTAKLIDLVGGVGALPVSYVAAAIAGLTSPEKGAFDSARAKEVKDSIQKRLNLDMQLQEAGLAEDNPEVLTNILHSVIGKPAETIADQFAEQGTFTHDLIRDASMIGIPVGGLKGLRAFEKSGGPVTRTAPLDVTQARLEPSSGIPEPTPPTPKPTYVLKDGKPVLKQAAPEVKQQTSAGIPIPQSLLAKEAAQKAQFDSILEMGKKAEETLAHTLERLEGKLPPDAIGTPHLFQKVASFIIEPSPTKAIDKLNSALADVESGFVKSNYKRVPLSLTNEQAAALGYDPIKMLSNQFGKPLSAAEVVQAQNIVKATNDFYVETASKVLKGETVSKETLFKAIAAKNTVMDYLQEGLGESARAMRASQQAPASNLAMETAVRRMMDNFGNPDIMKKAAEAIVNSANDPVLAAQTARFLANPTMQSKINQIIVNSYLSSPVTFAIAVESQASMPFIYLGDQALTATLGLGERSIAAALGKPRPDAVTFGEVMANFKGLYSGSKEGLQAAKQAWRTETTSAIPSMRNIPAQNAFGSGPIARLGNTPARAILTQDEFFSGLQFRMSLNGYAERQGWKSGLKGEARAKLVEQIKQFPTEEQLRLVEKETKIYSLKGDLGDIGAALSRVSNSHPLVKAHLPFVKIGINIGKQLIEHTPLALVSPKFYKDIKSTPAKRDAAIAKMLVGTALLDQAWQASESGTITGSAPKDPAKRAAWLTLHPERSFLNAEGKWESYAHYGIAGNVLTFGADLNETWKIYQRDRLINETIGSPEDSLLDDAHSQAYWGLVNAMYDMEINQTWFRTITNIVDTATANTENKMTRGTGHYLAGLLPVSPLLNVITKTTDPTLRRTQDSIIDPLRARLPWESPKLLPKINNLTGEPMSKIQPFTAVEGVNDKAILEIVRLGVKIPLIPEKMNAGSSQDPLYVKLTPEEQNYIAAYRGKAAKQTLDHIVQLTMWDKMPDSTKQKIISTTYSQYNTAAEQIVLGKVSQADIERVKIEIRRQLINLSEGQEILPKAFQKKD